MGVLAAAVALSLSLLTTVPAYAPPMPAVAAFARQRKAPGGSRSSSRRALLSVRGGADATWGDGDANPPPSPLRARGGAVARTRRAGAVIALTYVSVIAVKCTFPCVNHVLRETAFASQQPALTALVTWKELMIVAGKLLLGTVTDSVGAQHYVVCSMVLMAAAAVACGASTSFVGLALPWLLGVELIYAGMQGAMTKCIRLAYRPEEWAGQLALLGGASRAGALLPPLLYGQMLNRGHSWRHIFFASAAPAALVAALWTLRPPVDALDAASPKSATSGGAPSTRLSALAADPQLRWDAVARICLMVPACAVAFAPLYLRTEYGLAFGSASKSVALFGLGGLLSNVVWGRFYEAAGRRQRRVATAASTAALTAMCAALAAHAFGAVALSLQGTLAAIFGIGFTFAGPYYVPSQVIVVTRAGDRTATVSGVIDALGFVAVCVLNYQCQTLRWRTAWGFLTGMSAVAGVSLLKAMSYDE